MAAVVTGCGGPASTPAGSKAPYTISVNTDLSGPFSAVAGIPEAEGFTAYIASLNATGGINGHKILIQELDDRSDVQAGLANYQQVLNSDSLGMFLDAASAVSGPVGAKATVDKLPYSASSYNGGQGVFPYVYNITPTIAQYMTAMIGFASSKVTDSKGAVALLAYDSPSVRSDTPKLQAGLEAKGFTVAYNQIVPQTAVDFSVAAGQIASDKPAFVITRLLELQVPPFITSLRSRGITVPILNYGTNIADGTVAKINDPAFFNTRYSISTLDTSVPGVVTMRQVAQQTGHAESIDFFVYSMGYVHAEVVAAAIAKCSDPCTREKLNAAFEQTAVDPHGLMAGKPGFTKDDHVMTKGVAVTVLDPAKKIAVAVPGFGFS